MTVSSYTRSACRGPEEQAIWEERGRPDLEKLEPVKPKRVNPRIVRSLGREAIRAEVIRELDRRIAEAYAPMTKPRVVVSASPDGRRMDATIEIARCVEVHLSFSFEL